MKNTLLLFRHHISSSKETFLFFITAGLSLHALIFFYLQNSLLVNYDAFARLNIARKIIDNLTPGISQLGGLWLPLPQLLFTPFVWNDFLWHSGFAGSIISILSFIFGAVYLAKTTYLITNSIKAAFIAWIVYVSNQNILLMQTTPMSESFFLCTLIMTTYFLTKWSKSKNTADLLLSALWIMTSTLTRYEGYFILIGSVVAVFLILLQQNWGRKGFNQIEGTLILFLTIAVYGIFLWCVYCLIFFKDPFIWLHFYSDTKNILIQTNKLDSVRQTYLGAFSTYFQASLLMSGLIVSLLGIAGFIAMSIILTRKALNKEALQSYIPAYVISSSLFFMLVYGYKSGLIPGIEFHHITLSTIFDKSLNHYFHYNSPNIRYGLTIAPFIALFAGFFVYKRNILFIASLILVIFQIFTNFYTPLYLQFSIPKAQQYVYLQPAIWLEKNYDEGLILISASRHEDIMFQTQVPYKNFIHEGTRNYWKESLNNPDLYATWVVYSDLIDGDILYPELTEQAHAILNTKFKLVYSDEQGFKIYKRI